MTAVTPTSSAPLSGRTLLVIESDANPSQAVRLLALRTGARIRRAGTIAVAYRHLRLYRPAAVLIDPTMEAGHGFRLIADLDRCRPRIDKIVAMSDDTMHAARARLSGADGFLNCPIEDASALVRIVEDSGTIVPTDGLTPVSRLMASASGGMSRRYFEGKITEGTAANSGALRGV